MTNETTQPTNVGSNDQLGPNAEDAADAVSKAMRRAYSLGQRYWQQADSESYSQNKKADETDRQFDALVEETRALVPAPDEMATLRAEANKSERRAIAFGDIVHSQVVAMQAAVLEGHLKTPAHGLQWIVNTLTGPGHLPDLDEARALGGAQAWWDRETAKHEEFRAAHPGPVALGPNG